MATYSPEIREVVAAIARAVRAQGWSVDMVVDFGSHARGEARPDSDYDLNLYVHREGWLYLFEERARRVHDPADELYAWHRKCRQHFRGFRELSAGLEQVARDVIQQRAPELPIGVMNVHDTRLVLFNPPYENWPWFDLAGGAPLGHGDTYHSALSFLRKARHFHRVAVQVHVVQCDLALRRSAVCLGDAQVTTPEAADARREWLSSMAAYLRNSLSLLSLLTEGWFVAHRRDVLDFVRRAMPCGHELMQTLYENKCDPSTHARLRETGKANGEGGSTGIAELHRRCEAFGHEIHQAISETVASRPEFNTPVDARLWLSENLEKCAALPLYRSLVGSG